METKDINTNSFEAEYNEFFKEKHFGNTDFSQWEKMNEEKVSFSTFITKECETSLTSKI